MAEPNGKKTCFVVMGFGEKIDFATGRTLDLDKTYRVIIKKAVEEAGLECIRADDVIHSGTIDKPMYALLLEADVVVADLSTSNANALYELGVRHALRPHATIVIAEERFKFPFDLGHLRIRSYEHLGKGIDAEEAERVREELKQALRTLAERPATDSPVYTFLPELHPPAPGRNSAARATEAGAVEAAVPDESATELMERFKEARAGSDWETARCCLNKLMARRPGDKYLCLQRALVTYQSQQPDPATASRETRAILLTLHPEITTCPDTLSLWGAVHRRLWEFEAKPEYLDEAIHAHEKGFHIKNDPYNGIDLAFLLNLRASIAADQREAVADFVLAERVRRKVAALCEKKLAEGVKDDQGNRDLAETFRLRAALAEALLGSGDRAKAEAIRAEAIAEAPRSWMPSTLNEQLAKLDKLLAAGPDI
jgi:hypothetical protein